MQLSVIIVNYKTAPLINDCLQSIYANTRNLDLDIIVVDNDSNDDVELILRERYPEAKFIQMGYNAGFARANNAGIRSAKNEIVLLLNPDTIVNDDSLSICTESFSASEYVACGAQLLNEDGTPQISGSFFMKGALNNLLPLPYCGSILKFIAGLFGVKKPHVPEAKAIVEVDWINGAFLMTKKNVIAKAGPLDEDFFLYAEEIEWCNRIRKYGKLCIYGDAHVIHLEGKSANQTFSSSSVGYQQLFDKKGRQLMVSNFLRIRKQLGAGWFLLHLALYVGDIPFFFIFLLTDHLLFWRKPNYNFRQFFQYCGNVGKLISLSGKMIGNKPYFYKVL